MDDSLFTRRQLKIFGQDLLGAFVRSGFEILEEPYFDHALCGFRATYIRRYQLKRAATPFSDGILPTLVHVVGLPFGLQSQKMVILSAPRNINNEPIADTIKLRVQFDENGHSYVVQANHHHYQQQQPSASTSSLHSANSNSNTTNSTTSDSSSSSKVSDGHTLTSYLDKSSDNQQAWMSLQNSRQRQSFDEDDEDGDGANNELAKQFRIELENYVSHIIETISPGLIQLPTEMKLEILKKLSLESIVKMSQVNSEFRSIIFVHGESLWRHLCKRDFNLRFINRMVHKSWMELYRDSYIVHQIDVCRKERALPGLPERPALPPAPYRLQIGWLPEALELPFYPLEDVVNRQGNQVQLALEFIPLRRVGSSDSISSSK